MPFCPQKATEDYLHHLICLPRLYYKHKILKWFSDFCLIFACVYILLVMYHLLRAPEEVISQDIFAAGIYMEVLLAKMGIDSERAKKVCKTKRTFFWSSDFLTKRERKRLRNSSLLYSFLQYVFWLLAILVLVILKFSTVVHSKFVFDESWPVLLKKLHKIMFFTSCVGGYYIGNSHQTYMVYLILHNYYQMKILSAYVRSGIGRYKKLKLERKIYALWYQNVVREVLLRTIQQYQKLKMDGNDMALVYGPQTLWHFLVATTVVSYGIYCVSYDILPNKAVLAMVALHIGYGAILSCNFGQMFCQAYDDFYMELLQLDWYTFDKGNQKLYYMFLVYAQKENGIEVLSSVKLTRPTVTKFLKTIYSAITVLKSTRN